MAENEGVTFQCGMWSETTARMVYGSDLSDYEIKRLALLLAVGTLCYWSLVSVYKCA